MGRLTRAVAALALTATPVLGVITAVHPDGFLADNGVINADNTGGSGTVTLADNGVIHAQFAGHSAAVVAPADDGVVNSRD
jgi:hypothetical protein